MRPSTSLLFAASLVLAGCTTQDADEESADQNALSGEPPPGSHVPRGSEPATPVATFSFCSGDLFKVGGPLPTTLNGEDVLVGRHGLDSVNGQRVVHNFLGALKEINGQPVTYNLLLRIDTLNGKPVRYAGRHLSEVNDQPVTYDDEYRVRSLNGLPVEYGPNGSPSKVNGKPVEYGSATIGDPQTRLDLCVALFAPPAAK